MKYKLFVFSICIETVLIVVLLIIIFSQSNNGYSIEINYFEPNSILIHNDNLWSNISLTDNGDLHSVSINDYKGRIISVYYSEIGIVSYVISDDENNYKIESVFPQNLPLDMVIGKNKSNDELINENEYFYRKERYKHINKQYRVNYSINPYFFDVE
jgi:hypothetical protein